MENSSSKATRRIRRILVGFDGSASAAEATRLALDLAAIMNADVTILEVTRDSTSLETEDDRSLSEREATGEFSEMTEGYRQRAEQLSVSLFSRLVSSSQPSLNEIARYAQEHGFDMIVIGSHGDDGLLRNTSGRELEKLLRHAPCPILVTPIHSHHV